MKKKLYFCSTENVNIFPLYEFQEDVKTKQNCRQLYSHKASIDQKWSEL